MKMLYQLCAALLLLSVNAYAATPSKNVIAACLNSETHNQAKWEEIPTNEPTIDEDYLSKYKATLFNAKGIDVGYAEKNKQHALVLGKSVVPLKSASILDKKPQTPSDFSPLLANWSFIQQDRLRFMCVNFNFDGLGRSGTFQKVHGLYLLSIPKNKKIKPSLFYMVRKS